MAGSALEDGEDRQLHSSELEFPGQLHAESVAASPGRSAGRGVVPASRAGQARAGTIRGDVVLGCTRDRRPQTARMGPPASGIARQTGALASRLYGVWSRL